MILNIQTLSKKVAMNKVFQIYTVTIYVYVKVK